jgi:hypothetical protein
MEEFKGVVDKVLGISKPSAAELTELEGGKPPEDTDVAELFRPDVVERPVRLEQDVLREDAETSAEMGPEETPDVMPAWAVASIPQGLRVPMGRTVVVMRFRSEWTDRADKGDRTCVLWNLSVGDEKIANQRGGDNAVNVTNEQAKAMIRAVDGTIADPQPGKNVDQFWNEIGKKCRGLVINHYVRAHSLTQAEKISFLASCCVARTQLPTAR